MKVKLHWTQLLAPVTAGGASSSAAETAVFQVRGLATDENFEILHGAGTLTSTKSTSQGLFYGCRECMDLCSSLNCTRWLTLGLRTLF